MEYFMAKVSSWFNLAFFTASVVDNADPVIEWLTLPVHSSRISAKEAFSFFLHLL